MIYKQLGNSDLNVSRIGYGCMSLKPENGLNAILIKKALAAGVNFYDTSDLYFKGENEKLLGRTLKPVRKNVFISTKVGNQWRNDGKGWDWNPSPAYIKKAIDKSLERLQTDYIDLYLLHGGTLNDPVDDVIDTFERLKTSGKIRHYGISSIRPNVIREYVHHSRMTAVMTQYSLLDRRPEEQTLDLLRAKNIGVMVRGAVASGLLVDKPIRQSYLGYDIPQITLLRKKMAAMAGNASCADLAIRYVLAHPAITTAMVGMSNEQQLQEALQSVNRDIPDSLWPRLKRILRANFYKEHR